MNIAEQMRYHQGQCGNEIRALNVPEQPTMIDYMNGIQKDFKQVLYNWYECIKINYGNDMASVHYEEFNKILKKYNLTLKDLEG